MCWGFVKAGVSLRPSHCPPEMQHSLLLQAQGWSSELAVGPAFLLSSQGRERERESKRERERESKRERGRERERERERESKRERERERF